MSMKEKQMLNNYLSSLIRQGRYKKIYFWTDDWRINIFYNKMGIPIDYCSNTFFSYIYYKWRKGESLESEKALFLSKQCFLVFEGLIEKDFDFICLILIVQHNLSLFVRESIHHQRLKENLIRNIKSLIAMYADYISKNFVKEIMFVKYGFNDLLPLESSNTLVICFLNKDDCYNLDYFLKTSSRKTLKLLRSDLYDALVENRAKLLVASKKDIAILNDYLCLKSQNKEKFYIYSNFSKGNILHRSSTLKRIDMPKLLANKGEIENITIRELPKELFLRLRNIYLSNNVTKKGNPQKAYGLFSNENLFGVLGFSNEYYYTIPSDISGKSVYMLSDFIVVKSPANKLSKLVIMIALSREFNMLAERLMNKKIEFIATSVFSKYYSSMKYRGVFKKIKTTIQPETGINNLLYIGKFTNKSMEEILKEWKLKYLK